MALADIYVLEDVQVIGGVEVILNTYTYQRNAPEGSALELANAFIQDVQLLVEQIQVTSLEHTVTRVYSLGDLEDFAEVTQTGNTGVNATEAYPSYVAVNFTLRAASRAVRPGSKRYAGIPEAAGVGNVITNSGFITALNNLRVGLSAVIESPEDATTYSPVVVKRVPYVTSKGNDAYRYPQPGDTLVAPLITGALVDLQLSHQVSRGNSR